MAMVPEDNVSKALRLLFAEPGTIPTSGLRRLARTARTSFGLGVRAALGRTSAEDLLPLVRSLGEMKGLAMKLGQIMSYVDDTLPPEARQLLALLQTESTPASYDTIAAVIRTELGPKADLLLAGLEKTPVAAASIGQVHRGTFHGLPVAVKVQYPEIETAIRNDFRVADRAIQIVKKFVPGVDSMVDEARDRLVEECDYVREAGWQEKFGRLYAEHPTLSVPCVFREVSSRRVLVTAWKKGLRFEDWLAGQPTRTARDRAGAALYEFYLGSLYRWGWFNADPHPGNYLFGADGRLVMLDYGCVREFSRADIQSFVAMRSAVVSGDDHEMRDALRAFGGADLNGKDFAPARRLLTAFFGSTLRDKVCQLDMGPSLQMRSVMADKKALMKLRLPGKLLFLFRIKFGVHAVLTRIGTEANWFRLEEEWIRSR